MLCLITLRKDFNASCAKWMESTLLLAVWFLFRSTSLCMLIVPYGQPMFMKLLKEVILLTFSNFGQQEQSSQSAHIVERQVQVFSAPQHDQDAWQPIIFLVLIEIKKWRSHPKTEKKLYAIHVAKVREEFNLVYLKNMPILKEDSKLLKTNSHGIWLIIW